MSAEYRFKFTEEFLLSANRRYRRQLWWYQWYRWLKVVAILCFVALIAILASAAAVIFAIVMSALLGLFLIAPHLNSWLARRSFRRSPYYNDDIVARISSEGISLNG